MEQISTLETLGFPFHEIGEEAGLRWGIALAPLRTSVNGYVQLNFGHPLYEKFFDPDFDYMFNLDVEVHGGVTFFREGVVGFDTMHYRDVWEDKELAEFGGKNNDRFPPIIMNGSLYWTKDLVIEETKSLARHLAEMTQA